MNRREAKRYACGWAADVLAAQPVPYAPSPEDQQRVEEAVAALVTELRRRSPQQVVATFEDVPLFALVEL